MLLNQGFFQNLASSLRWSPRTWRWQPGVAEELHLMDQCPAFCALERQFCKAPEAPRPSCPQLNNPPFIGFFPPKTHPPYSLSSAPWSLLQNKTPAPTSLSQDLFSEELDPGHTPIVASPLYPLRDMRLTWSCVSCSVQHLCGHLHVWPHPILLWQGVCELTLPSAPRQHSCHLRACWLRVPLILLRLWWLLSLSTWAVVASALRFCFSRR